MPQDPSSRTTRLLLGGLGMGESPRWHDGRLWFSNWGTNEIVAVDLEGTAKSWEPALGAAARLPTGCRTDEHWSPVTS
jgi:sugar lactone lactonase YvrE